MGLKGMRLEDMSSRQRRAEKITSLVDRYSKVASVAFAFNVASLLDIKNAESAEKEADNAFVGKGGKGIEQVNYPQLNTPVYTDDGMRIEVGGGLHNEKGYGALGLSHINEEGDFGYKVSGKLGPSIQYINGRVVYVLGDTKIGMEGAYLVSEEKYNLSDFGSGQTGISQYGLGVSAETYLGEGFTAGIEGQHINTKQKDLGVKTKITSWEDPNYFYEETITTQAQFTGGKSSELNATFKKSFPNGVDLRVKAGYNWYQEGEKYDETINKGSGISYGVNGSFPLGDARVDLGVKRNEIGTIGSIGINAPLSNKTSLFVGGSSDFDDNYSVLAKLGLKIGGNDDLEKLERLRAIADGRLNPNKEISYQQKEKRVRVNPSDLKSNPDFKRIQIGSFYEKVDSKIEKTEKNTLNVNFGQTMYELETEETFSKNLPGIDSQGDTLTYEVLQGVEGIELNGNQLSGSISNAGTHILILSYTDGEEEKQVSIIFEIREIPFTAPTFNNMTIHDNLGFYGGEEFPLDCTNCENLTLNLVNSDGVPVFLVSGNPPKLVFENGFYDPDENTDKNITISWDDNNGHTGTNTFVLTIINDG